MSLQSSTLLPSQASRPLRHWSEAELARGRGQVDRVWLAWCERWQFTNAGSSALNACDTASMTDSAWHRVATHPLWLSTASQDVRSPADALQSLLFGSGAHAFASSTPIAHDVAEEAMADLGRSLSLLVNGNDKRSASVGETPASSDLRRWSGALVVQLSATGQFGEICWTLHCGIEAATNICASPRYAPAWSSPPLIELAQALRDRRLSLSVCLEHTPVTLGTLQTLRVGDVLPLAHRLDQPLRVVASPSFDDATPFCAAYLGSHDKFRAVELVSAATASQSSNS